MMNSLITYLQIFGIGFSFGIIGPCFLTCAPILITYIVGSKKAWPTVFKDIFIFLSGRFLAYLLLGALAGLSGAILQKFISLRISSHFQTLAGAVTIFFAFMILLYREDKICACPTASGKIFNFGGVFSFGFLIGLSPCAPLLALLFDIALISNNIFDGILYALFFGLGTFLSGLIIVGIIAGVLTWIPSALIKSKAANIILKIFCAALLMLLGISLICKVHLKTPF